MCPRPPPPRLPRTWPGSSSQTSQEQVKIPILSFSGQGPCLLHPRKGIYPFDSHSPGQGHNPPSTLESPGQNQIPQTWGPLGQGQAPLEFPRMGTKPPSSWALWERVWALTPDSLRTRLSTPHPGLSKDRDIAFSPRASRGQGQAPTPQTPRGKSPHPNKCSQRQN